MKIFFRLLIIYLIMVLSLQTGSSLSISVVDFVLGICFLLILLEKADIIRLYRNFNKLDVFIYLVFSLGFSSLLVGIKVVLLAYVHLDVSNASLVLLMSFLAAYCLRKAYLDLKNKVKSESTLINK